MVMKFEQIKVECYFGFKANERPIAFFFQGTRHEIREIIDRWYDGDIDANRPELNYFKVRTTEDRVFILRYNALFDAWSVKV